MALVGAAALLLALVISACGSSGSSTSGGSTGGGGEEGGSGGKSGSEVHIAVVTASTTQNAFQEMTFGAEAAAEHEGVEISASAPNGVNPTQEVSMFQAATQTA
ncbi:MAG: hypothetical protein J0H06_04310, partial [Actinobacteria bacterium]|nr:hypothetical protein [Actinomycetota bacterium]